MRPSVPLAALGAAALLLSACSSSSGSKSSASPTDSGSGSTSSTAPASSTPSSAVPASSTGGGSTTGGGSPTGGPASTAQLQKIVIQAADLPATYKAVQAAPDTGEDESDRKLASCTGVSGPPSSHKVHTAQSPDFELNMVTVSSEFSSYRSQSDVDAAVAQLKSPKINRCLNAEYKAELTKSAGPSAKINSATITLTPGSGGGPKNVAALASGTVDFTVSGQRTKLYVGIAFITGPQLDGTLTFFGINKRLDTATQMSVLTAVAKRAQNP